MRKDEELLVSSKKIHQSSNPLFALVIVFRAKHGLYESPIADSV